MTQSVRCEHCSRILRASFSTDLHGRVSESVEFCGCPTSRRLAHICRYCDRPIDKPRSSYCGDEHRDRGQRDAMRRYQESDKGEQLRRRQNKKRRNDAERARRRARYQERKDDPAYKTRKRRNRRNMARKNPTAKARYGAQYKARYPDRVKAQQDAANAKRAAAKREHMHTYCTKYVGRGIVPKCSDCPATIPFDGVGRPMKKCRACDPARWVQRDRRAARASAIGQREAA